MLRKSFFAALCFGLCACVSAFDNGRTPVNTLESGERMINDLIQTFGDKYPKGKEYLGKLKKAAGEAKDLKKFPNAQNEFNAVLREAALANPLLDFDKILIIRRQTAGKGHGFIGLNAHTNEDIPRSGWDNELGVLTQLRTEANFTPFYRHPGSVIMRDMDLHFGGEKVMFSSLENGNFDGKDELRWAIYEIGLDGKNPKKLTPFVHDVDWFDSCYLPDENAFITGSTAGMQGLPCEGGGRPMVNLYRVDRQDDAAKSKIRQLTFEQDSDWNPSVMEDGRVMYLRWEYSDIPHYMSRILFAMQPDGRQQRAVWGSNSIFPTAYKSPRQIPKSSEIIGVVSGHHTAGGGNPEVGRLVIVNPQLAVKYPFRYDAETKEWGPQGAHLNVFPRVYPKEVTGCIQEIPGWGKDVVGNAYDNQGGAGTYRFCFPYPLNSNYFLVSMRYFNQHEFGLYLVDRFDNITLIKALPKDSLFQPIPLVKRQRPPVKPDITEPNKMTGSIFITDIYHGLATKGIPRGTIKSLRIFAYHFGFRHSGGHDSVGRHASWDIKRILGTVPVEEDGSVSFNVPANTPIAMQPLDVNGRAVQLMRSWTVCMPGEQQSCVGCHEMPLEVTPTKRVTAANRKPSEIAPWYGPARSFGYEAEIQPLLDKRCLACHNDVNQKERQLISFEAYGQGNWRSDTSYAALNPYIWRPGPEPDLDLLPPMDYHASVSELVQRLQRGHYGTHLDKEDWDRLNTWIDLNVPYRGLWSNPKYEDRRLELAKLYANLDTNPEDEYRAAIAAKKTVTVTKITPEQLDAVKAQFAKTDNLKAADFPFDAAAAVKKQRGDSNVSATLTVDLTGETLPPDPKRGLPGDPSAAWVPQSGQPYLAAPIPGKQIDLGQNRRITFVPIPAGEFVMGQLDGLPDERQRKVVKIERPFWIAETEITNGQYGMFDPEHDTRYLPEDGKDHIVPGYIANHPDQPVSRISFQEAEKFCEWLSKKTGKTVKLPTEPQWEWAARAGTETAFWYGDRNADFSKYANLSGDETRFTRTQWENGSTVHFRRDFGANSHYPLRDKRFSDKWFVVDYVKQYEPNPWGLYDMIGNVWEWTYPEAMLPEVIPSAIEPAAVQVVAKGGSWKDRPVFSGSSAKVYYLPWQKVMNVGFRPVILP
ncbi:MAG: SUMF1/EgtB/PvdO family nonheme iron enzyme [Planctomycetaceae bacterium]|jgi:formylglycine-generating enzyme required for sulfatase activity|nr:SUMF1/EgtB/PvdO family nonheme iron enzyme [Planctomycetaceae bacterium]